MSHVCRASRGSDLVLLGMMTLPEGLAGHCLTVIRSLLLWGSEREGWRGGEVKRRKKGGGGGERRAPSERGKEKPPAFMETNTPSLTA